MGVFKVDFKGVNFHVRTPVQHPLKITGIGSTTKSRCPPFLFFILQGAGASVVRDFKCFGYFLLLFSCVVSCVRPEETGYQTQIFSEQTKK